MIIINGLWWNVTNYKNQNILICDSFVIAFSLLFILLLLLDFILFYFILMEAGSGSNFAAFLTALLGQFAILFQHNS